MYVHWAYCSNFFPSEFDIVGGDGLGPGGWGRACSLFFFCVFYLSTKQKDFFSAA